MFIFYCFIELSTKSFLRSVSSLLTYGMYKDRGELFYTLMGNYLAFLDLVFYPAAAKSLEPFDCVVIDNAGAFDPSLAEPIRVMEAEPSITCGKGEHTQILLFAKWLILPALFMWPLIYLLIVLGNHKHLHYLQEMELRKVMIKEPHLRRIQLMYAVVYQRFRPGAAWWGGAILLRKISMLVLYTFLSP